LKAPLNEYDIIFTSNTTEAINIVAHNLVHGRAEKVKPVIVNTVLEHHSNELPWRFIPKTTLIRLSINDEGFIDLNELECLLQEYNRDNKHGKKRIKIITVSGTSNVIGTINDLQAISQISHSYGAQFLVDGAQMVGHQKVNLKEGGIDYFAFSSHKAYAPFGSGALVVKKGLLNYEPTELNEIRLSGDENIVGIAAMGKAFIILKKIGMKVIEQFEKGLTQTSLQELNKIEDIEIFGIKNLESPNSHKRGSIITFSLKKVPHNLAAKELAENGGIGIRNGCFCAHILIQQILKLNPIRVYGARVFSTVVLKFTDLILPGLLRVSFGIENDENEVDSFIKVLKKIASQPRSLGQKLLAQAYNGLVYLPHTKVQENIEAYVNASVKKVFNLKK